MERLQKTKEIELLREKLSRIDGLFVTEYRGIKVGDVTSLRRDLRRKSGELKVIKNRLAKIAVKGTPYEEMASELKGPVAVAFSYGEVNSIAKVLTQYATEEIPLKIRSGYIGSRKLSHLEVKQLAILPSREILLSQLLGNLNAPISGFVRVLAGVPRQFAQVLNAIKDKKEA